MPNFQSEDVKIIIDNYSFPRVEMNPQSSRYGHTLVPLHHDIIHKNILSSTNIILSHKIFVKYSVLTIRNMLL